jgi:hypothetical protein
MVELPMDSKTKPASLEWRVQMPSSATISASTLTLLGRPPIAV